MSISRCWITSLSGMWWTRTSNIDFSTLSGSIPWLIVRLPCGSRSMQSTLWPDSAKATARLRVEVVFATPPFWLAKLITLARRVAGSPPSSGPAGSRRGAIASVAVIRSSSGSGSGTASATGRANGRSIAAGSGSGDVDAGSAAASTSGSAITGSGSAATGSSTCGAASSAVGSGSGMASSTAIVGSGSTTLSGVASVPFVGEPAWLDRRSSSERDPRLKSPIVRAYSHRLAPFLPLNATAP